ncbi:MAG: hypothetical protein V7752_08275 [Halopseudomonas sp.]
MSLDRLVEYTVVQAIALLSGKISLQALNNSSPSVQNYCTTMFESEDFWQSKAVTRYHQQIIKGIRQGVLRTVDSHVIVKLADADGKVSKRSIKQDQLSDEHEVSVETRISKSELRYWVASSREAHSFLMNRYELSVARSDSWEAGKQAFLEAEGFGKEAALEPAENMLGSDSAAEIKALLEGTHEFQDEDLRIALQAWLTSIAQQRQPKDGAATKAQPDGLEQEASSMMTLAATFKASAAP